MQTIMCFNSDVLHKSSPKLKMCLTMLLEHINYISHRLLAVKHNGDFAIRNHRREHVYFPLAICRKPSFIAVSHIQESTNPNYYVLYPSRGTLI